MHLFDMSTYNRFHMILNMNMTMLPYKYMLFKKNK